MNKPVFGIILSVIALIFFSGSFLALTGYSVVNVSVDVGKSFSNTGVLLILLSVMIFIFSFLFR